MASLNLMARQQAEFEVEFHPEEAQRFEATMQLLVKDNPYEKTLIQLLGEGYRDIISLDNISSKVPQEHDSTESEYRPCVSKHLQRLHKNNL